MSFQLLLGALVCAAIGAALTYFAWRVSRMLRSPATWTPERPVPHKLEPRQARDLARDIYGGDEERGDGKGGTYDLSAEKPAEQHHDVIGALGDDSWREMENQRPDWRPGKK